MKKYILCENNYKKISIRVKKEVPQRCCSIEDTIAESPCDKAAGHTEATKPQGTLKRQTKQRRAPAKPMHTEKDTVDVRKSQDKERAGRL